MEETDVERLICVTGFGQAIVAATAGLFITWRFICYWGASMTTSTCRNGLSGGASSTG